ncbi:MAG: hypothetical protein GY865_01555 [candidate division Zixibacteria bacterium]|nr:hypothetical protein [candidate division Zixibacteria bacterium]
MLTKKRTITFVMLLSTICLFTLSSCAGLPKLFNPPEPYCTIEEQETSLIYKYLNPTDAKFTLMLGVAAHLDKHPENAGAVGRHLSTLRESVEDGITYAALSKYTTANFGVLVSVVLSEALQNFKSINLPLSVCDKRLVLGAIDKLLGIVEMVE